MCRDRDLLGSGRKFFEYDQDGYVIMARSGDDMGKGRERKFEVQNADLKEASPK
jgi:hypothetical protein